MYDISSYLAAHRFNRLKVKKNQHKFSEINIVKHIYRYVILGNHRDAWTFGGVDPNSGTAALLEVCHIWLSNLISNYHLLDLLHSCIINFH